MIEKILKFQKGGNSRQMLRDAEGTFRAAYAKASEDAKRLADALIQSASNYTSANPSVGRNNRLNQAQVYEEATRILRGEGQTQAPSISGGWGNRVINDFYALNKPSTTQSTTQAGSSKKYTTYKDYDSNYFGMVDDNWDLNTRVEALVGNIMSKLDAAESAINNGAVVRGMDAEKITSLRTYMNNILNTYNTNKDARALQSNILKKAQDLGITDKAAWDAYFGETDDLSEYEKRLNQLKNDGYSEIDLKNGYSTYLQNLGKEYKFMRGADGRIKVFNSDLSDYTGGRVTKYNDDWRTESDTAGGYQDVFLIDDDGYAFLDNYSKIDPNSAFALLFNEAFNAGTAARLKLHREWDIDDSQDTSGSAYFQALQNKFGTNIKGSDVSSLFSGNERIWATDSSGNPFEQDAWGGNARFKSTAKFYTVDDQGNVVETSWAELAPKYRHSGWDESDYLMGQTSDMNRYLQQNYKNQSTYSDDMDLYGRTFGDALLQSYGIPVEATTIVAGAIFGPLARGKALDVAATEYAKMQLKANGKRVTKKAIEEAAKDATQKKMLKAFRDGTLKAALKKAGIKTAARLGIHGALATSGLASFGIGTAVGAGLALGEAGIRYASWDNINENQDQFIHNVLNAVQKGGNGELRYKSADGSVTTNAAFLNKIKFHENKNELIEFLYGLIEGEGSTVELSVPERQAWNELKRLYNSSFATESQKNGGNITYAAKGTVLDPVTNEQIENKPYQDPTLTRAKGQYDDLRRKYAKSAQQGYGDDIERMDASEAQMFSGNFNMSSADTLRILTMAQDAASIVASFVPGAGTGVAAGLGVTAMGTDFVADMMDPAVSAGEVVKNLGMNAAFAGLGLIPGAKMWKVAKNIVKYAPKIVTAAAGLGIAMDESTLETFKKIGDGTTKFDREDWRNISHVLSLIAGATRGVRQGVANRKVKNSIVASDNVKLKGVKNADGTDYELPKQTIKDINAELAKAKTPDDVKAIQQKYNNLPDEAIDAPMIKEGQLAGKYKLVGTEATADADKTYDSMRALWNADAKALKEQSKTTLGKAAIRFANRFGGGAYGANQRAMLSEGLGPANNMKYDNYNPLVDWKGLRNQSGMRVMSERVVNPSSTSESPNLPITLNPTSGGAKRSGEITGLAVTDLNPGYSRRMRDMLAAKRPRLQKPYDGTDRVGDAIRVNPTRNEASIKGADEVRRVAPKVDLVEKPLSKFTGRDFVKALTDPDAFFKVQEGLAGEIKKLKKLEKTSKSIPQLIKIKGRIAMLQEWQKRFKTAVPPYRVDNTGQMKLPFRQGGQLKYQHLRK